MIWRKRAISFLKANKLAAFGKLSMAVTLIIVNAQHRIESELIKLKFVRTHLLIMKKKI